MTKRRTPKANRQSSNGAAPLTRFRQITKEHRARSGFMLTIHGETFEARLTMAGEQRARDMGTDPMPSLPRLAAAAVQVFGSFLSLGKSVQEQAITAETNLVDVLRIGLQNLDQSELVETFAEALTGEILEDVYRVLWWSLLDSMPELELDELKDAITLLELPGILKQLIPAVTQVWADLPRDDAAATDEKEKPKGRKPGKSPAPSSVNA